MREISGVWRRGGAFELRVGDHCSGSEARGVQLAVTPHTTDARSASELLRLYNSADPQSLQKHAGDAAFVLFDAATDLLLISRDFFGTTPLYYVTDAHVTAFATSVRKLREHLSLPLAPNRRALAALLVDFSAPAVGETYFEDVFALPPGAMFVQRGPHVNVVHADPPQRVTSHQSFEQTISRFSDLFRGAVHKRVDVNSTTAVLVSGGLDSAAILCAAAEVGSVVGITYGMEDGGPADESRYIDMLRGAGHRIERVPLYPTFDMAAIERSVLENEAPAVDFVALTVNRAARAARLLGATSLLMGILGDQVLSPFPPPYLARIAPWRRFALRAAARDLQQYMSDVSVAEIEQAIVRQSLRLRMPGWMREMRRLRNRRSTLFDELAADFRPPTLAPVLTTFGDAVWHSVTAPSAVEAIASTIKWGFSNDLEVRLPFLDADLVRFLITAPDEFAYRGNSLKPLLRASMKGLVPDELLARRDKGDYTAALTAGMPPGPVMLDQLNDLKECVDFGLMSPRRAVETMARLRGSVKIASAQRTLLELATLSLFLRVFFSSPRARK